MPRNLTTDREKKSIIFPSIYGQRQCYVPLMVYLYLATFSILSRVRLSETNYFLNSYLFILIKFIYTNKYNFIFEMQAMAETI